MTIYVERTEDGLQNQIDNFLLKAPKYPALALDAAKQSDLRKDWTLMAYLRSSTNLMDTYLTGLIGFKNVLRNGGNLGALPPTPVLTAAPALTSGGMEIRFRNLIQDAMRSPNITEAIAKDLGILAPTPTDTQRTKDGGKPAFKLSYSSGGHPLIAWKKGAFEGVEIHKSKDGINFTKLDKDYKPDFIDKTDLPEPAKAEAWYYKLIYIINDEQVGQWSDVQSISVHG